MAVFLRREKAVIIWKRLKLLITQQGLIIITWSYVHDLQLLVVRNHFSKKLTLSPSCVWRFETAKDSTMQL